MGKKKSTKSLGNKEEKEDAAVKQKQPSSSTPKKAGNEIDEIFSGKKRKRPEQEKTEKTEEPKGDEGSKSKSKSKRKNKEKSKGSKEDGTIDPVRPRKRTEDGLVIYTEEELGINKSNAGGTPLCPFDCDCCS